MITADCFNPRFRAHHPNAQEVYLEEVLEEKISVKMISKDSDPLAFVVPDGCDSVDFAYGPIEVNPGVGKDQDHDLVVAIGEAKITGDESNVDGTGLGPLAPGSALIVTVPWRAASWVSLSANHLKVTLYARFYSRATQSLSATA